MPARLQIVTLVLTAIEQRHAVITAGSVHSRGDTNPCAFNGIGCTERDMPSRRQCESTKRRNRRLGSAGSVVTAFLLARLAFGSGWWAANNRHDQRDKDPLPTQDDGSMERNSSNVMVTVEPATHRSVQRTVEALGTLHGFEEVSISARVEGRIRKILHDVSDQRQTGGSAAGD